MSRDEILTKLLSLGAVSLMHTILDVEAGRVRRILLPPIPGEPAFAREVLGFLRGLGAEVELPPGWASTRRLRSAG